MCSGPNQKKKHFHTHSKFIAINKIYGTVHFIPYLFSPLSLSLKYLAHCFSVFFFCSSHQPPLFKVNVSGVLHYCVLRWCHSINKIFNISHPMVNTPWNKGNSHKSTVGTILNFDAAIVEAHENIQHVMGVTMF